MRFTQSGLMRFAACGPRYPPMTAATAMMAKSL